MNDVIACIDGSALSSAVCDAAAWASSRLNAPLTLLHVLEKTEHRASDDLSGNIGLGSREHLLEELTALDERRGRLALEHGQRLLDQAETRALQKGAVRVGKLQRHGRLPETLLELEPQTHLVVMGRLGEGHAHEAQAIGSQLETVVRSVHCPILIALRDFVAPTQFLFAFDGSDNAQAALEKVAASPLLQGLPCHLVTVGQGDDRQVHLSRAQERLVSAGFEVTPALIDGEVQPALANYQKQHRLDLLVMGAYGHSRIRRFFVGSNTTRMVTHSEAPLLLLR